MRKILFWGIAVLVIVETVVYNVDWINYKLFWAQTMLGIMLVIYALGWAFNPDLRARSALDIPIIAYLSWVFISFLFSDFKSASTYALFNILTPVILYFIFSSGAVKSERLNLLINLWILGAVYACIYGFFHNGPISLPFAERPMTATFGNPNLWAAFLVSTIPFAIAKLFQTKGEMKRLLYVLVVFIFGFSLYLTGSRAGIGAGICAVLLFFGLGLLFRIIGSRCWVTGFFWLVVLILTWGFIFRKQLISYFALRDRIFIWQGALQMIRQKPFLGWGVGNFAVFFPQFAPHQLNQIYPDDFVAHAHNEFLNITAELGIIGLVLFFWFLFRVFRIIKRNISRGENNIRLLTLAAASSISGVIIISLFDVSLRFVFTAIYWWLAIAILAIMDKIELKKVVNPAQTRKSWPLVARLAVVAVSIFLSANLVVYAAHSLWAARQYSKSVSFFHLDMDKIDALINDGEGKIEKGQADAQTYFNLGTIYAREADWKQARDYLEQVIKIEPEAVFAYTNLGNVYFNLSNIDKAVTCYRRALEIAPDYLNAHYNMGFVYFRRKQLRDALREFDFVLSKNRNDFQAWQMRQLIFE